MLAYEPWFERLCINLWVLFASSICQETKYLIAVVAISGAIKPFVVPGVSARRITSLVLA